MNQQSFDFAQPQAPRAKKAAPRRAAPAAQPAPFPNYKSMQATIKELRAEVTRLKKERDQAEFRFQSAGKGNIAHEKAADLMKSRLLIANARNSELIRKVRDLEVKVLMAQHGCFQNEAGSVPIPQGMLSKLIRLAHPDKHANSSAANDVTAWLLKQRRS